MTVGDWLFFFGVPFAAGFLGIVAGVATVAGVNHIRDRLWLRKVRKSAPTWAHHVHHHDWRGMGSD
jgi:hypothetical protein